MAGVDVIPGRLLKPIWSRHVDADQPQPATGKGLRGHHRLGPRLPLRRLRHAPRPQIGPSRMTFETDSKSGLAKNTIDLAFSSFLWGHDAVALGHVH